MPSSGMFRGVALVRTDVLRSVRRLLVVANVAPSSSSLVTLIGSYNSHTAVHLFYYLQMDDGQSPQIQ
jgi:heme/copper-type cytochrome/quinol oxidase subunit 4